MTSTPMVLLVDSCACDRVLMALLGIELEAELLGRFRGTS